MKFTEEHIRILEKNRSYYDQLKSNGSVRKLSSVVLDELQKVYSEAVREYKFSRWCASCNTELLQSVYLNYEQYLTVNNDKERILRIAKGNAADTRDEKPDIQTEAIRKPGRPRKKDK